MNKPGLQTLAQSHKKPGLVRTATALGYFKSKLAGVGKNMLWPVSDSQTQNLLSVQDAVDLYLHFGFLPRPDVPPLINLETTFSTSDSAGPTAEAGVSILKSAVQRAASGFDHVIVPISGGLDSRAILAVAVEIGLAVDAFTVGTPGTDDFDYGTDVANFLGVQHVAHDVREFNFSMSALEALARSLNDWVSPIDIWFNTAPLADYNPSLPVLTGLYGDFVAGEFAIGSKPTANTFDQFVADEAHFRRPLRTDLANLLRNNLPASKSPALSEYEICRLIFMHTCTYRPNVFGLDREYRNPFADEEWVVFMMGAGMKARKGKTLYHDVLRAGWPSAFGMPTKNLKGASLLSSPLTKKILYTKSQAGNVLRRCVPISEKLLGPGRGHNYADFLPLVKSNESFRRLLSDALSSLKERDLILPIDPERALNAALDGKNIQIGGSTVRRHTYRTHPAKLYVDLEINLRAISHL